MVVDGLVSVVAIMLCLLLVVSAFVLVCSGLFLIWFVALVVVLVLDIRVDSFIGLVAGLDLGVVMCIVVGVVTVLGVVLGGVLMPLCRCLSCSRFRLAIGRVSVFVRSSLLSVGVIVGRSSAFVVGLVLVA